MRELKSQLVNALLAVLTAAGLISAFINFQQQKVFPLPEDGVTWVDRTSPSGKPVVVALDILPESAADRAGLKNGDTLVKINNYAIDTAIDATRVLARVGVWKTAEYLVVRNGVEIKARVIVRESLTRTTRYYLYGLGLCYLIIGLFVYLRRSRAPRSTHFYILCLASFVLFTFHYSGKLNNFDKVMYWGNVLAGLLAPTIFFHFCVTFPEPRRWLRRGGVLLIYLPATLFAALWFGFASGVVRVAVPLVELRWLLDRAWLLFLSAVYLTGAFALVFQSRRADDPIIRQQLKWLRNGALLGLLPFTLGYTIPYALGVIPGPLMDASILPMMLTPLAWAYAILRYKLMDVDVIFQQGFAYTLATIGVMGVFYALVLSRGPLEEMEAPTVAVLIMVATFIFQPLRNWMQENLDRYVFYKDRYDYRLTLVEFARELSSETDLDRMLASVAERLRRTLSIKNVGLFLASESGPGFELTLFSGEEHRVTPVDRLDLSFLPPARKGPIFFERTRLGLDVVSRDWPASVRNTVARLDLTYYIPCQSRGRTIAFIGASRTLSGDFLSSDDIDLLAALSGSLAIAIENARLYRSLQRKVGEYERLKEFSENIVESLNVGIVAAGLDDRVESWNSQMEALSGVPRDRAMDQPLRDLFPASLVASFDDLRQETGVCQLYKIPLRPRAWTNWTAPAGANGASSSPGSNGSASAGPAERLVNIAVAPLVTRDSARIGRLIIFDDVTERAELEQRLVQSDKLSSIGLLAAGVAHEVNTPLAVISTYAQMLTKQISGDDPKTKLLEKIAKQTFRASEIVNSLLNFSRTSKSEFEEIDLNRSIRETLSLVEHQLGQSGIQVQFESQGGLTPVRGNSGKLQQVFLNLFLNARDAMESGGVLRITTSSMDGLARIEVCDSGRGIAAEDLPRIYDPFFTTKGARKGTGLGLAVTYGIVREHGGNIRVTSAPGAGTTFSLDFPLAGNLVNV